MRKTRDSGLSNRNPKSKVSKDNEEDVPEFPEEDYAAKSFIRNLSISLGKDPASLYP